MTTMRRFIDNWPKIAFIYLPLLIAVGATTVMVREQSQPDTDKAIRLVRESNSRKENFTVQQYLYSTVYHRRRQGEPIEIAGWRATRQDGGPITVQFGYTDAAGQHMATWEVDLPSASVRPSNDNARELSWH